MAGVHVTEARPHCQILVCSSPFIPCPSFHQVKTALPPIGVKTRNSPPQTQNQGVFVKETLGKENAFERGEEDLVVECDINERIC